MKKSVVLLAFMLGAASVNAQLVVKSNGKIGVGTSSPSDLFEVHSSSTSSAARFQGGQYCVRIYNQGEGTTRGGINILNVVESGKSISGIDVNTYGATTTQSIWGTKCLAGYSTTANYGVWGGLITGHATNGAGVFGTSLSSASIPSTYQGLYAGYFQGDVRVTGSLYGTLLTPSASSPTSNVVQAYSINGEEEGEESVSDKLQQVQLLQFYRSPDENKLSEEEIEAQREALRTARLEAKEAQQEKGASLAEELDDFEDEIVREVPQTKLSTVRYGLAADQLKEVYPELVYEDQNGNTSINYIEMIPLLVQAINEVKVENTTLKEEIATLKGGKEMQAKARTPETTSIETADEAILSLSQNNPNPFSEQTSIEVSVPESVHAASLYIYDMSGKQIKRIDIMERGVTRINVTSEGLNEGMYLYSLIADGKVAGTKKMILTK